jgi:hypothetical protein
MLMRRTRTDYSDNTRITIVSDEEGNSYCNLCDALLFERRDGSMICSNGYCAKTYSADSVKKHRTKLGPMKETESPEIVPLRDYANYNPRKAKPKNPIDYEDEKMFKPRAGFSITSKISFLLNQNKLYLQTFYQSSNRFGILYIVPDLPSVFVPI